MHYGIKLALIAVAIVLIIWVAKKYGKSSNEGFLSAIQYSPCYIDPLGDRSNCKGYTTGLMPSIETETAGGWLCPGLLGVPP
jgi:hypothetical protein